MSTENKTISFIGIAFLKFAYSKFYLPMPLINLSINIQYLKINLRANYKSSGNIMLISFNASTCLPQLSKQLFMVCSILCMSPAASSSISALFILPCTSLSSIKHSMFSGIGVEFALISFFSFSHSVVKRTYALGFLWASTWILKQKSFFNF